MVMYVFLSTLSPDVYRLTHFYFNHNVRPRLQGWVNHGTEPDVSLLPLVHPRHSMGVPKGGIWASDALGFDLQERAFAPGKLPVSLLSAWLVLHTSSEFHTHTYKHTLIYVLIYLCVLKSVYVCIGYV